MDSLYLHFPLTFNLPLGPCNDIVLIQPKLDMTKLDFTLISLLQCSFFPKLDS